MNVRRVANVPLELANAIRRWLFARRWLPSFPASRPVISVGNIVMGGTGKTPLVKALAQELLARGAKPAVLTRGYRRRSHAPLVLWGPPTQGWAEAGDEPTLLARELPDVPVVVDADRVRGARTATQLGASHLVLDDGFQHLRLRRQVDLVVVHTSDPLGRRTWRREGPWALRWASRVVTVGPPQEQEQAARQLRPFHPLPPFSAVLEPVAWVWEGRERPLEQLAGQRVVAFAGIGHPERFFRTLAALGVVLVTCHTFADHHPFRRKELERLATQAEKANALLVATAKDHVRLPPPWASRVTFLQVELVPLAGSFGELLAQLG